MQCLRPNLRLAELRHYGHGNEHMQNAVHFVHVHPIVWESEKENDKNVNLNLFSIEIQNSL